MTQVQSASGLKPARSVTAGAYTCSFRHRWGLHLLVPSPLGLIPARSVKYRANFDGSSRYRDCSGGLRVAGAGAHVVGSLYRGFDCGGQLRCGNRIAGLRVTDPGTKHHADDVTIWAQQRSP